MVQSAGIASARASRVPIHKGGIVRRKGIGIGGLAMLVILAGFVVFLAATRLGLDLVGPQIVDLMEWVHEMTGWYEGARASDR
jgi:hypothetical protein